LYCNYSIKYLINSLCVINFDNVWFMNVQIGNWVNVDINEHLFRCSPNKTVDRHMIIIICTARGRCLARLYIEPAQCICENYLNWIQIATGQHCIVKSKVLFYMLLVVQRTCRICIIFLHNHKNRRVRNKYVSCFHKASFEILLSI
jgi:hypothetical protein